MKVLVTCVPQAGHVNPLLPLLSALVAGGDDVVVASGDAVREQVTGAGARFEPAGRGMEAWFATLAGRTKGAPGDGLPPERIGHYFMPRLFAEIAADDMVDDAVTVARQENPDVVLFDSGALVGPLVARLVGARPVHHTFGQPFAEDVLQLCRDAVSPLWRRFGLDAPVHAGTYDGLTVAVLPPSMDPSAAIAHERMSVQPAPPPVRAPQPQSPPLVYFSLGTLWAEPTVVGTVMNALADTSLRVLATLGRLDPDELTDVPRNVEVHAFVPQRDVLPDASIVIHHGGAGTMFGALAHGLPQVVLPQAADNFVNAELLRRRGVAACLPPGDVSTTSVRAAVDEVLTNPSYAAAAREVAAEIASLPTPAEAAERLRRG